jgi:hypothetical protein
MFVVGHRACTKDPANSPGNTLRGPDSQGRTPPGQPGAGCQDEVAEVDFDRPVFT